MLVLSRSTGEGIVISQDGEKLVQIFIKKVMHNSVQLAFEADKNIIILRNEVKDKNDKETNDGRRTQTRTDP